MAGSIPPDFFESTGALKKKAPGEGGPGAWGWIRFGDYDRIHVGLSREGDRPNHVHG